MFVESLLLLILLQNPNLSIVFALEECCTEHKNLRLGGRSLTFGQDKDWNVFTPILSKETCMQNCLDKPNCVASMFQVSQRKCHEYYQTPKQSYDATNDFTTFLCRTRTVQVCYKTNNVRSHSSGALTATTLSPVSSDQDCMTKCKAEKETPNQFVHATCLDTSFSTCWCYFVKPGLSFGTNLNTYLCSNRAVSCKAKNAAPGNKQCERFNKLRLYGSYGNNTGTGLQIQHDNKNEEQCLETCLLSSSCVAATHLTGSNTNTCYEFTGNIPGEFPEPDSRYVSFICQ